MLLTSLVCNNLKANAEANIHTEVKESVAIAKAPEPEKQPDALDAWIEKLMMQESGGRTTFKENGYLPYIIDVNGLRSYSCLMFQEETFARYSKIHGITGSIENCNVQKKVAKAMLLESPRAWTHWYNSVKHYGVGYPPSY